MFEKFVFWQETQYKFIDNICHGNENVHIGIHQLVFKRFEYLTIVFFQFAPVFVGNSLYADGYAVILLLKNIALKYSLQEK